MKKTLKAVLIVALTLMLMVGTAVAAETVTFGKNASGSGLFLGKDTTRNYIADLLKFDVDTLRAERQAGKSMVEIAEGIGISGDKLIDSVTNFRVAELDKAIADGKITEAQAETCLVNMAERIQSNLERTPEPRNYGKFSGDRQANNPIDGTGFKNGSSGRNR